MEIHTDASDKIQQRTPFFSFNLNPTGIPASIIIEQWFAWSNCHMPTTDEHPLRFASTKLFGIVVHKIKIENFSFLFYLGFDNRTAFCSKFLKALTKLDLHPGWDPILELHAEHMESNWGLKNESYLFRQIFYSLRYMGIITSLKVKKWILI